MDYDLLRVDYIICGVTYPDTLKILPSPGPKLPQKFAVGDKNGVLQCLSIKDEEPIVLFKTLPGKAITSIQLAAGSGSHGDKIFAASGNEVKGYTRKGKVFLALETTLSETITSMSVLGGDLVLGSGRVVTHYRDLREVHSYICEDRILDLIACAAPNSPRIRLIVLIANKGAILLEGGQLVARVIIRAGPTRLLVPPSQHSSDIYALYGAADGSIGIINYNNVELSYKCSVEGQGLGAVVCMGWWINGNGTHLAVGRHDGSVQLYLIDLENLYEKPRLKYTYFCGEPVTSVAGGCIGIEECELLAATFSGRIFSLRTKHHAAGLTSLTSIPQDALAARRTKLETEIARLEKQAIGEREKYQRNTRTVHGGFSAPPLLDIQCELSGATSDGWQEIRITSAVPLDMLFVYSNTLLDLQTDSAAVLSICPSQGTMADLLATVRCQAGTRRLWVRVRRSHQSAQSSKIDSIRLLIYALPAGAPRVARLLSLRLPALPYYSEYKDVEDLDNENRLFCEMKVIGGFSVAEMTSWLAEALPGEMPRPTQSIIFARAHTLLQTVLICQYQRGSATFKSDNVTTTLILKNIISNCSLQKSIRVEINCDVPDNVCLESFKMIENKLSDEYKINQETILYKAMHALDIDFDHSKDNNTTLCEDYQRIWHRSETENVNYFNELIDTIKSWCRDWRSLSLCGSTSSKEESNLREALMNCNIETVKDILINIPLKPN